MIESSYLRFLSKSSIFALIPGALEELAPFMEIQIAAPGKAIYNAGDKMDSLIIPLQEPLSLCTNDKVLLLQKGRALGLTSLLRGTPIPYKVVSEDFNKLLVLPRIYLMEHFERNKNVLTYLMLMTESESFRKIKHILTEKGISQADIIKLSAAVSEKVTFSEKLLEEGILLFEDGSFKVEGDEFSGVFKGGEFAGGFHSVNRPNPGYHIAGNGNVRILDPESVRKSTKSKIILEYLGSDPWVKVRKIFQERSKKLSLIPESVISEWDQPEIDFDPKDVKLSHSDWESIRETLYMVLRLSGVEVNRSIIDNRLARTSSTMCLSVLAEILEFHGLITRMMKWKDDVGKIAFPLILPFGDRIVLVLGGDDNTLQCFDACQGFYRINKDYFLKQCPDVSISLAKVQAPVTQDKSPKSKDQKEDKNSEKRSRTFSLLFNVIRTEKRTAFKIALLTLGTYALGALSPKLNELLMDEVLRTEDHDTLWMCLSGLFLLGFFTVVFTFSKNKLITRASMSLDDILTRYIYAQALKLKPQGFSHIGTGGVISRLSEIEKIRSFFSTETLNSLFDLGAAVIYGAMLATYDAKLVLFILAYFVVLLVLQFFGRKYLYKVNLQEFYLQSKTNSFIGDSITNVLAIKAFSAANSISKEWENLNVQLSDYSKKSAMFSNFLDSAVDVLGQVVKIGIIWYCMEALKTPAGGLSFGELFAIIQLIGQTIGPMGNLVNFLTSFEDMKLSVDKVNDILFAQGTEQEEPHHSVNITGKIKMDRVSFKYSDESPLILRDITLTIYPGQSVAIVGKSGSGKTTIANLIAKENNPSSGRIYFDDIDASFIDADEIKSQVGYIQQNNQLFSGSIRSNVAYKDEAPDDERLAHAYSVSNSDAFITSFPQRDENYLAEGGMGLSGGQKQRLTMARTVYGNPKIMILDEATSALDSESEGAIITKLLENKGKVTSIIIAHRLSTIRNADFVFVVDKGQIVQEGTHNELIQQDGVYKELFQDQAS